MIALDSSALLAIALHEADYENCLATIEAEANFVMSAVTLMEVSVVAMRRNILLQMRLFIAEIAPTIVPVDEATAQRAVEIYALWGKGFHPAKLNLGDCFSYDTANQNNCPLLFIGNDFAQTDLQSALDLK